MYTPDFITWIRKAGYVSTGLLHMDQEGLAMCASDFIMWIRKAAYVYT